MMNMNMKALVTVTVLAIGSQAQAAIFDDNAGTPGGGTGAGELFLSIVDRNAVIPRSYTRDLGITVNEYRANPLILREITADPLLTTFLAEKTGTIYWNVAGMSNTTTPTNNDYGYLSTSLSALNSTNVPAGFAGISNTATKLATYVAAGNGTDADYAANGSKIETAASGSLAYYDSGAWGDMWNTAHSTEAEQSQALNFWFIGMDFVVDPETNTSYAQNLNTQWKLAANGDLSSSAVVVPVPAAVWLLGSALVGLVGVARRKLEQVQV